MNWKENIDPLECKRNLKSPQELEKKIVEDVAVQEDLIIKKLKGHSTKKK